MNPGCCSKQCMHPACSSNLIRATLRSLGVHEEAGQTKIKESLYRWHWLLLLFSRPTISTSYNVMQTIVLKCKRRTEMQQDLLLSSARRWEKRNTAIRTLVSSAKGTLSKPSWHFSDDIAKKDNFVMQLAWNRAHSLQHICTVSTKHDQNRLSELSATKIFLRTTE